jgi:hypothetical protein
VRSREESVPGIEEITAGQDPSVPLVLSAVEWIRMTTWEIPANDRRNDGEVKSGDGCPIEHVGHDGVEGRRA